MAFGHNFGLEAAEKVNAFNQQNRQNLSWANALANAIETYGNEKKEKDAQNWEQEKFNIGQQNEMQRHADNLGFNYANLDATNQRHADDLGFNYANLDATNQRHDNMLRFNWAQLNAPPRETRLMNDLQKNGMTRDEAFNAVFPNRAAQNNGLKDAVGSLLMYDDMLSKQEQTPEVIRKRRIVEGRLNVLSKDPEALYNQSYSSKLGAQQALVETAPGLEGAKTLSREQAKMDINKQKEFENASVQTSQALQNISKMREIVANNPTLSSAYAPVLTTLGRYTNGDIGFSKEQLKKRGELLRRIGEEKNRLIAQAKDSGQTGINTVEEAKRATLGLDENSSQAELLGALDVLEEGFLKIKNEKYNLLHQRSGEQSPAKTSTNSGVLNEFEIMRTEG